MGLLSPLIERRSATYKLSGGDPELVNMFGGSRSSKSAQNVNAATAMAISTVYACVNRKAKTIAMLPLNVMENMAEGKGVKIANLHRCQKQLNARPNRWQTSFDWRFMMDCHRQLKGNAYSYILYHPGRGYNELIPLEPSFMYPFMIDSNGTINFMHESSPPPSDGDTLWYQYIASNGKMLVLRDSEVLHLRGYSSNGIVGKNVISLMRESVGLAMATEEQGARLFSNGAQIGKVFEHPGAISDATYSRLKAELDNATTGVSNAHKTLILEDGMKVKQTTLTMVDSQFLESRQFQVEDICSFMDVPLILINRSGDKNQTYASAEQIISIFITHMMAPDFVCWEQVLNKDLLYDSEKSKYYFDFDFSFLLRGDTKARAEYLLKRFQMGSMSPDEIKIYEGENPTGTKEGKEYYLQSGMMPIKLAGKQPAKPVVAEPKEVKDPVDGEEE
jgi:HK97 family phage portal protein